MKRFILLFTVCLSALPFIASAQTAPVPQNVPYTQNFSALAHASTTYPAGIVGWKLSSAATASFVTGGPTGDQALLASSSASSTAGGIHNYNGKIGILTSGSTNPGIILSLITTGLSNVSVSYDIMVIRNPYDGASNTRINESTLQYRIGNAGAWTTLTGLEYVSGTVTQTTSGVTTPQNQQSRSITLPDVTDNQPEVQIRWLVRDMTGAGSRPSFAVDNISVEPDNDGDGFVASLDCNDADPFISPAAAENCNGFDDDCDALIDEGTLAVFYVDADGDLYGDATITTEACVAPGGFVGNDLDCDDANPAVNPEATEICNGLDDDCDALIDDADPSVEGLSIWFADADGDTFGDGATFSLSCNAPAGYVVDPSDCNDANADVNPAALEVCNGIDDNCDGTADEGLVFEVFYADADGDLFGDAATTTTACDGAPVGFVSDATDCNDAEATVYPGAAEICDGLDNDCNGDTDENVVTAVITPAGTVSICKGEPAVLTANAGEGYTYQWFKNGNVIPGATSVTYLATKPAYYQVQVNLPEGCFALSPPTTVQVLPNPNANITAPNGTSLCTTVKLKASYDATYTYQWNLAGSPIAGATAYQYFPTVAGNYNCTITNASGCDRTTATVAVTACRTAEMNGSASMQVFPNPADRIINIVLHTNTEISETAQLQLFDLTGRLILQQQAEIVQGNLITEMDITNISASGMYLIRMITGATEYQSQIVISK